jgi:pimeloyl-ACP methyl ester carboxylesterase
MIFRWIKLLFQVSHVYDHLIMNPKSSPVSLKMSQLRKWFRPILALFALGFSVWFFYSVYVERNGGNDTERIGNSADDSKRLRTEVRTWFRKTFPESAARADEQFGFFEFEASEQVDSKKWVLLAHGLDEPGNLWADLAPALVGQGYRVLEFRYPNDQPIHESSVFFRDELTSFLKSTSETDYPEEVHLIAHSMGGLVLRNFITHPELLPSSPIASSSLIQSFIQLATPNHGSWLATYRFPVELRDHLFKDYGFDALLGMVWDGAGEAQIDLKPESAFLEELNGREFPESIYWVGVAGIGSPVDLKKFQTSSWIKNTKLSQTAGELNETFPELFKGTGDGCVSTESLRCPDMNALYFVECTHRSVVRDASSKTPPAIPIVLDVISRN